MSHMRVVAILTVPNYDFTGRATIITSNGSEPLQGPYKPPFGQCRGQVALGTSGLALWLAHGCLSHSRKRQHCLQPDGFPSLDTYAQHFECLSRWLCGSGRCLSSQTKIGCLDQPIRCSQIIESSDRLAFLSDRLYILFQCKTCDF